MEPVKTVHSRFSAKSIRYESRDIKASSSVIAMRTVFIGLAVFASTSASQAQASDCKDAVENYNSALSDVTYTLRRYARCISASAGQDDCSSEFRRLKNAQSDLESAVNEIGSYCRD